MSSAGKNAGPSEADLDLLPGEVLVGRAPNTCLLLFSADSIDTKQSEGVCGTLFITNHRLMFRPNPFTTNKLRPVDQLSVESSANVPLGVIHAIYSSTGGRKRQLHAKMTLPKKISELEVECKDLRRLIFNMRKCSKSDAIHTASSLGMYSSPSSLYHLFAFDYARVYHSRKDATPPTEHVLSFFNPRDWQKELDRLGVSLNQWRVTEVNNRFHLCESLPPFFVCPSNISDDTLEYVASLHRHNRLPVWCWSHPHTGVSLTRAASPDEDKLQAPDPSYMYAVSMARNLDVQVENKHVHYFDISTQCGFNAKDLQTAYLRLQELCTVATVSELTKQDQRWLLGLDSSKWLLYVRACLQLSSTVAATLCLKRTSCLLLEEEDRDISCVISSLIQIMVDPHFRSITGFESLIQKEWTAMGHPFTTRNGFLKEFYSSSSMQPPSNTSGGGSTEETERGEAPVFLLFLDCVWQLSQQFPAAFQFSETYLLNLYSLVHGCQFGNFVFDSGKARLQATHQSKRSSYVGVQDDAYSMSDLDQYEGPLVSAWGMWLSSLSAEETENWLNPFYYVFGTVDANYDCLSSNSMEPLQFQALLSEFVPDLKAGGNFGLYPDLSVLSSPVSTVSGLSLSTTRSEDPREFDASANLLQPCTLISSLKLWSGYFFRYIPSITGPAHKQRTIERVLESRLVKDVRKLKNTLNDYELRFGAQASNLSSFVTKILKAREEEKKEQLKANGRMSMFPVLMSDEDTDQNIAKHLIANNESPTKIDRSQTLPAKFDDSMLRFASRLYRESSPQTHMRERTVTSASVGGRSPVFTTRIRVQREENTLLANRYVGSSPKINHHKQTLPIMPSPTIPVHKKSSGVIDDYHHHDEITVITEL